LEGADGAGYLEREDVLQRVGLARGLGRQHVAYEARVAAVERQPLENLL
jgi:hypothetical protein